MKVIMIETGGWGGLAHYTWNLCQALAEQGEEVRLLTHTQYELHHLTAKFACEPCFDGQAGYLRNAWSIWRHITAMRPDVVHVQSLLSTRFDPWLWKLVSRRVPVTFTLHNVRPHEQTDHDTAVVWRCCRVAPAVIVHTKESVEEARKQLDSSVRIEVIRHGDYAFFGGEHQLDRDSARRLLDLPLSPPIILAFGAIRPYKDIHGVLAALRRVHRRRSKATLVVAGPLLTGTEQEYRDAILAAGLEATVLFRPTYVPHDQVAAYFAGADVAVFNYRDITDSGALRIACSNGTPIVATAVGGFKEFLKDGKTARLVPPGSPRALAAALVDVLADPNAAALRAKAARALVTKQWSWQESAKATRAFYRSLLRRTAQRTGLTPKQTQKKRDDGHGV